MSEKMDAVTKEVVDNSKSEDAVINSIEKGDFFEILERYDLKYDMLKDIFEGELYTTETQNSVNIILRRVKKLHGISLTDSVLFLEEFTRIKKILNFLDNDNKWIVKTELSEKYNIEIETTILEKILC